MLQRRPVFVTWWKLSAITADSPATTFAKWHAEIEMHLMDSGDGVDDVASWFFHDQRFYLLGQTRSSTEGVMYQSTGDGKWPSIAAEDIAAVAVKALTEPGHEGRGYTFTGS
jgi:uncharacterized protein YbjT (DUF2867 family)